MRRRTVLSIGAAAFIVVSGAHAQQPGSADRFRVQVERVTVDATVTDNQGNSVAGLTAGDLELYEDGKPQTIATLAYVDIPIQMPERFMAGGRFISGDVRSNRVPSTGRLYLLVLDDVNIGAARTAEVKAQARRFIESYFAAGDTGAVGYTSGRADGSQEFTTDPQLLLNAIDKFAGLREKSTALDEADKERRRASAKTAGSDLPLGDAPKPGQDSNQAERQRTLGKGPTLDIDDFEHSQRAIAVLQTLGKFAGSVAALHGRRKALIMFSEGLDYQMSNPFGMRSVSDVLHATQDTISMAARSNIAFFTIDPRGLVGMSTDFMQMPAGTSEETLAAFRKEFEVSQDSLRTLADETGGFTSLGSNDLSSAFDRIVENSSHYYVVSYEPPAHPPDGHFHSIELRVKQPGLKVTARKGYVSPRSAENQRAQPRDILDMPLQQAGLNFSVHAAPFRTGGRDASIALSIEIDGEHLPLAAVGNGAAAHKIELSFYGINEKGEATIGTKQEIGLNPKPETIERIKANGIRINPRITLAPGRYQLRVGAHETAGGAVGSVFYDLTVPDFGKDLLSMSGLLLTSAAAQQTPTAAPDPLTAGVLPGAATSRREFPVGDQLSFYAEVYDNSASTQTGQPGTIDVNVRLISESDTNVFSASDSMPSKAKDGPATIAVDLTLEDLTPGHYLLHVDAKLHGSDAAPVARETLITVVP